MPTVILLDVSLSMSQPVTMTDCSEEYQLRHLAVHGLNTLLDLSAEHSKLEFFSLVIYSSLWEQLVTFTRDYDGIKAVLDKVEDYDKTCLEGGLLGAGNLLLNEWDIFTPCQIVLVTDGGAGVGQSSLPSLLQSIANQSKAEQKADDKLQLPFGFPCKVHVMCLGDPTQLQQKGVVNLYQKLLDLNNQRGEVFIPDGPLTLKTVQAMFTKLSEKYFRPYEISLLCGHLQCDINLYPPPDPYTVYKSFEIIDKKFDDKLTICGFLDIADVASPPITCRHLVLPRGSGGPRVENSTSDGDEDEHDEGKIPAFTVLLHGALKVEGMVALTQIAEDWFGILYSWADNKKKSNLVLSVFEPGAQVVSWLGNMNHLAPVCDFSEPPYGEEDNKTPFPVRPQGRRSYAQNSTVWIKPSGLQADIQKILRHARKLPEKQQHFYKELNRLRRSALCLGFHELLDAVSAMLDRECQMLPGTAHPDAALQLSHAANSLRGTMAKDITQNILPLRTNFTGD